MNRNAHTATVNARGLAISKKFAVEICNYIRYKPLDRAQRMLSDVILEKKAVPFRRYKKDQSHKQGVGPGRYPVKASKVFINLLDSLKSNAEQKGLQAEQLVISVAITNKGPTRMHHGRNRGKMKNTHVTLCAEERVQEKKKGRPVKYD